MFQVFLGFNFSSNLNPGQLTLPQKAHYIAVFLLRLRPFTSITSSLCQNFTNATSKTWIHLGPVWNACNVTSKVRIQLYFGSVCIAGIFFSISTFFSMKYHSKSILISVWLVICTKYVINILLASSFHQVAQYVTMNCGRTILVQYEVTNYFSQHEDQ